MSVPVIERGRVCLLLRGRRTGKKVVIAEVKGNTAIAIVDGKEKKYNIRHLFPTSQIAEVPSIEKPQAKKEKDKKEK